MALWSLDKATKNYISAVWKHRRAILGELRVSLAGGRATLVRSPTKPLQTNETCKRPLTCQSPPFHLSKHWSTWLVHVRAMRRVAKPQGRPQNHKGRWNFYSVWSGRKEGVCYKLNDCLDSMRGHPDPGVKGFATPE